MNKYEFDTPSSAQTGSSSGDTDPAPESTASDSPGKGAYEYLRATDAPLVECLDDFWCLGIPHDALPDIDLPGTEPYDILKRLGPSPFESGSFPLIGFLASAYDRVSRFADERRQA